MKKTHSVSRAYFISHAFRLWQISLAEVQSGFTDMKTFLPVLRFITLECQVQNESDA